MAKYDAVVVGSGPNGLAAGIALAKANCSVLLIEGKSTIGGGMRSQELTLPGFKHDVCSAILPLGIGSPFFSKLPLNEHGLKWIHPLAPLVHPLQDGSFALLEKSLAATCQFLAEDKEAYRNLMQPFVEQWDNLAVDVLAPLHFPHHLSLMAKFGYYGIQPIDTLVTRFKKANTRALFAGLAAHSFLPLDKWITSAISLVLGVSAHAVGWPMAQGGTQSFADALASYFKSLGGQIQTDTMIESLDQIPKAESVFLDVTPQQLLTIVGDKLPFFYANELRKYRYGPGVFKIDWALSDPIPWKVKECGRAGTIHLGGTFEEIAESESLVSQGKIPQDNFLLLAQPTLFDPSRAPQGKHIAWAYCHVPNGSRVDMTQAIESQIEKYAPGFKDTILARSTKNTVQMENYNPNYIGGDINGGIEDIYQLFTRPAGALKPYNTPIKGLYICSSSTPPGGGVHGMCGYYAAQAALKAMK